jgi:hypothetical protein
MMFLTFRRGADGMRLALNLNKARQHQPLIGFILWFLLTFLSAIRLGARSAAALSGRNRGG